MLARSLSALIIVFWLATTGWLVRSVWFNSDARFEPVATEEALGAFFRWNETSNLTILENGQRLGLMVVNGYEGKDSRTGELRRGFSTQGSLDEAAEGGTGNENLIGTTFRMAVDFDKDTQLKAFQVVLWVPKQELDVRLELAGDPPKLAARVTAGSMTVYEMGQMSIDRKVRPGTVASAKDSAEVSPPSAAAVAGWMPGGGMMADPTAWQPEIEASRGVMELAGSLQPVYLVKIRFGSGESSNPIKLYFSEAGEPWKIDTGWGFEAIAEVLIPVESQVR